jgi:hypothetical protein
MNQSTKRILFSVMAVIFLLTACAPSAPAPTQDPALVQQLIEQSVALTVAAQNAQTLEAQALIPDATNTPLPTQTEAAPALPTATPFVIVPPTNTVVVSSGGGGGGGGTVVRPQFACDSIRRRPFDNTVFKPNDTFDIKWTIVNTGTSALRAGLDLKYFSGPKMTASTVFELPAMQPGDQYEIDMDGVAPDTVGFHVMTWTVEGQLCYPYVAIYVER